MRNEIDMQENFDENSGFLKSLPIDMPYSVASDYFNNFHKELTEAIHIIEEKDVEKNWGKTIPYHLPEHYFEEFETKLLELIYVADLEPVFSKSNPYAVPEKYFEHLSHQIVSNVKKIETKESKTIPLFRVLKQKILRYAVAAVLILGLGLGAIYSLLTNKDNKNTEVILASVSKKDIFDYYQQNLIGYDNDLISFSSDGGSMNFDRKEIVRYLNEVGWD